MDLFGQKQWLDYYNAKRRSGGGPLREGHSLSEKSQEAVRWRSRMGSPVVELYSLHSSSVEKRVSVI